MAVFQRRERKIKMISMLCGMFHDTKENAKGAMSVLFMGGGGMADKWWWRSMRMNHE